VTIVDVGGYLPARWSLLAAEPLASTVVAASVAVWLGWTLGHSAADERRARRGLGAQAATQLFSLALTGQASGPRAGLLRWERTCG
jgi:hypothetical protein